MKRFLIRSLLVVTLVMLMVIPFASVALADSTADVTINATPAFVLISCNLTVAGYDFGVVNTSSTTNTTTTHFGVTNNSSVQTDQTIGVTTSTWSGGLGWSSNETGDASVDSAGLKSQKEGIWGAALVAVQFVTPDFIAENQAATTNYSFGLSLNAPTSFSDGIEKEIVLRVTAAVG